MVYVAGGEVRMRRLPNVLADLQEEARGGFAGSGEAVDRFLAERREEAARKGDLTA